MRIPGHLIARQPPSFGVRRKGIVLIAVLIVIVVLTLAAYQFSELMTAENKAATSYVHYAQARALAESGIAYTAVMLNNSGTLNGNPYSNASAFQGVAVGDGSNVPSQGRFSIIAAPSPDDIAAGNTSYRFGVTDEGGKINLAALMELDSSGQTAYNALMSLPNMTEDVANSILDWIDSDDTPRSNGAESDYYSSLSPPYQTKNGNLDSLEELLLVKGVTPQLLFGNDMNRNGILDPDEDDGTGTLDQGWSAYLTIYSREQNISSSGSPRIYLNDPNLSNLYQSLTTAVGPDMANFILAYRTYGSTNPPTPATSTGGSGNSTKTPATGAAANSNASSATSGVMATGPINLSGTQRAGMTGGGSNRISSIYSLVGTYVQLPASAPGQRPTIYPSPLNDAGQQAQLLPLLLDQTTTVKSTEIPARVNVNTAPSAVLQALPGGLSDADIQNILNHRPSPDSTDAPDPIYQTTAWLLTQANISAKTLQAMEQYISAGSQVYRVQSVGYFDGGGPTVRIEAIVDTNGGRPRILSFRDLTELGKGYDLQTSQ
jgi:type II secretory pathway component PulK